jgi:hypothetical protein
MPRYRPDRSGVNGVVDIGCGLGYAEATIPGWKEGQDSAITRNRAETAMEGGRASPGVRSIAFVTR